jgi:DNA-binding LacI/PurR family transcriptional regulator
MRKPKISDIAKRASVSKSTISRYLNGSLKVKDETRLRIEKAIKDLNYVPNQVARSLRTRSSRNVGVIVPNVENPLFAAIVNGIEESLRLKGYNMLVLINKNDLEMEQKCVESILGQTVDGVIFIGYPNKLHNQHNNDDHLQKLIKEGIEIVFINRIFTSDIYRSEISYVNSNYAQGAKEAMRHLAAKGRQKVAFIIGNKNHPHSYEKLKGFQEAMQEYNLTMNPELIEEGYYEFNLAYKATQKLLKFKPDAFAVVNDLMAVACMKALRDQNIRIPEDIAVIGYGDTILCKMATPELSSINQNAYDLGSTGGELLLEKIDTKRINQATILLPTSFIPRQSS